MGHYGSEMEGGDDSDFRRWLQIRNENDYIDVKTDPVYGRHDVENTMVQHKPCGLIVGNMIRHLDFCPALDRKVENRKTTHWLVSHAFESPGYGSWECSCGAVGSGYRFKSMDDLKAEYARHQGLARG